MAEEPKDLILHRVRLLSDQLIRTNQKLDELASRVLSQEQEMLISQQHRLRHEIQIADIHAMVEKIQRRLEINDGRD